MVAPGAYVRSLSVLVVAVVAVAGVERWDLLWWRGPFALTPSVLFAVALLGTLGFGIVRKWIEFRWRWGLILVVALIGIAFLSVAANEFSVLGLGRAGLFALAALAPWLVVASASALGRFDLLRNGAWIGLSIFLVVAVVQQVIFVTGGGGAPIIVGPFDLSVSRLGAELSRTTGATSDPNRACLTLAMFAVLLLARLPGLKPIAPWKQLTVAALLVLLAVTTWSRSGLVLFAVVLLGVWIVPALRVLPRRTIAIIAGAMAAVVASVIIVALIAVPEIVAHLVMTRLVIQPGDSASEHFELLQLAMELIVENPLILIMGIGFGASYTVLGDSGIASMAAAGDHANFHSAYSTLLIETGFLGLVVYLVLVLRPIVTRWAAVSIGLLLFGILYQSLMDASHWMLLAVAWTVTHDAESSRTKSPMRIATTQAALDRVAP